MTKFTGLLQQIRFESVSFSYAGALTPSLNRISFMLAAGAATVLVGASGAGKTTIVNLLLRLYRQDSGSIVVDGISLDELDQSSWLSRIAISGQDIPLIKGTVRENLFVASSEADLATIYAACQTAGILDTIQSMLNGLDSWIGQQGSKLSAGQRQRLGLARALLRDPDILILAEALNALYSDMEGRIWRAIRQRLSGRTLLVITHRPETVMLADQVICIGAGRVLHCGSPAELSSRTTAILDTLLIH